MTQKHDPVQQAMIDARKAQILQASIEVFADKGFHRATIKEIAKTAGIADGTIYNYFKNKKELLLALLDGLNESDTREEDMLLGMESDIRTFLSEYIHHRLTVMMPHIHVLRAILPEIMVDAELRQSYYDKVLAPTFALMERSFEARVKAGELTSRDPKLTVRLLGSTVSGVLMLQMLGDTYTADNYAELTQHIVEVMLDGMIAKDK